MLCSSDIIPGRPGHHPVCETSQDTWHQFGLVPCGLAWQPCVLHRVRSTWAGPDSCSCGLEASSRVRVASVTIGLSLILDYCPTHILPPSPKPCSPSYPTPSRTACCLPRYSHGATLDSAELYCVVRKPQVRLNNGKKGIIATDWGPFTGAPVTGSNEYHRTYVRSPRIFSTLPLRRHLPTFFSVLFK